MLKAQMGVMRLGRRRTEATRGRMVATTATNLGRKAVMTLMMEAACRTTEDTTAATMADTPAIHIMNNISRFTRTEGLLTTNRSIKTKQTLGTMEHTTQAMTAATRVYLSAAMVCMM